MNQTVAIVVGTFGSEAWKDRGRALTEAMQQQFEDSDRVGAVVHTHASAGLARARNDGAGVAQNHDLGWLCFLDGDDTLAPDYMDAMFEAIELECSLDEADTTNRRMVMVPSRQWLDADTGVPDDEPEFIETGRPLMHLNRVVIGALVPTDLFFEVGGFDPGIPLYEDWHLWLRCERAGADFVDVPAAVYQARRSPEGRNFGQAKQQREGWYWRIRAAEERARGLRPGRKA